MAIKKDLSDSQIIAEIKTALCSYNLPDIKKVCEMKMTIAGFILCSCLIDHIAGFRYRRTKDKKGKIRGSRKRYLDFVDVYLSEFGYDGAKLYDQLRCQVVHSYTSSDSKFAFDLMHDGDEHVGNWAQPSARERLDLQTFITQLEVGLNQYLKEIEENDEIRKTAIENYKEFGIFYEKPEPVSPI